MRYCTCIELSFTKSFGGAQNSSNSSAVNPTPSPIDHSSIMEDYSYDDDDRPQRAKSLPQDTIIELLSDDDVDDCDEDYEEKKPSSSSSNKKNGRAVAANPQKLATNQKSTKRQKATSTSRSKDRDGYLLDPDRSLQGGLVLEEDVERQISTRSSSFSFSDSDVDDEDDTMVVTVQSYIRQQQQQQEETTNYGRLELYHDPDFESVPASIEGAKKTDKVRKCWCSKEVELSYITRGQNKGKPYFHCQKPKGQRCRFFRWAFQAEHMHWYRFGQHTGHLVSTQIIIYTYYI